MEVKSKEFSKLIADVWMDDELLSKLKESPNQVLSDYGIEVDSNIEIEVCNETGRKKFLIIPSPPEELMFEEVLENDTIIASCQCQCQGIPPVYCCRCHSGPNK
jgi:hypothetical protein